MSLITAAINRFLPWSISSSFRAVKGGALGFIYAGNGVYCPICRGYFRKFLAAGDPSHIRFNARCPRCNSLERHRMLWLFLMNKTDFFTSESRVLHFAPEHCFHDRFQKMSNLDYVSVDLDPKKAMIGMDITDLQFENHSLDYIFCLHVLEHVPDDVKAMSELRRVLKRTGMAIIMVPTVGEKTIEDETINTPEGRLHKFGQRDHVRVYGSDIKMRLERVEFVVEALRYLDELDRQLVSKSRLIMEKSWYDTKEYIFVCRPFVS